MKIAIKKIYFYLKFFIINNLIFEKNMLYLNIENLNIHID